MTSADGLLDTRVASVTSYAATPAEDVPWPGVVVAHEVFGLTDEIHRIADRFACLVRVAKSLSTGTGQAAKQILASKDAVASWPD